MILQTVSNKCVRFGEHVDIEVSYKLLQLDVLKEIPSLQNLPCFDYRLFWGSFDENFRTLGVNFLRRLQSVQFAAEIYILTLAFSDLKSSSNNHVI
jgi:hypothetical protein